MFELCYSISRYNSTCYGNILTGSYSGYFPKEGNAVPMYHWINRTDPPSIGKKLPFIRNYGDRKDLLKINKDIGKHVQTIFEQVPEGNKLSSSCFLFRGAYFVAAKRVSDVKAIFKHLSDAYENPGKFYANNEVPMVSVGYIFQTHDLLHKKGFNDPEYINLIIDCDKYLGELV